MKNIIKIFLVFAAVIFLFAACGQTEEEIIDVSDVKDMVFWSEEPIILYYGEGKIIVDGNFGVVVYDLENSRLTDRITHDQMREWEYGRVRKLRLRGRKDHLFYRYAANRRGNDFLCGL